jgi:UDP-MurNAc hydroxylase
MKIANNRIIFLNHSSIVVQSNKTKILCDPWFTGSAFNNGWRLLHENSHDINDVECDFIWISHEHPDHLSIPTLTQLTKRKHFLYQSTQDKKVLNYIEKNGHFITELNDSSEYTFNDIKVTSFISDSFDSATLFTFENGEKFLNINDVRVELGDIADRIKKFDLSNLKIIAIQFSYANWAGNEGDNEIPLHQQDLVIERISKVFEIFKPQKILLFASYIYYSHKENFYFNKVFWLPYVLKKLSKKSIGYIVPMPDQVIYINDLSQNDFQSENDSAITFWSRKHEIIKPEDFSNANLDTNQIKIAYFAWYEKLWSKNKISLIKNERNKNFKLVIFLTDINMTITVSLFNKKIIFNTKAKYDCKISSETLIFLLKNNFGRGTVTINSRIQFNYDRAHKFFLYFYIPYKNNLGKYFKENAISFEKFKSIENTSVMTSIFKINSKAIENFYTDLRKFT